MEYSKEDLLKLLARSIEYNQKLRDKYIEDIKKDFSYTIKWSDKIPYAAVSFDNSSRIVHMLTRHESPDENGKIRSEVTIDDLKKMTIDRLMEFSSPCNSTSDASRAIHKAEAEYWSSLYKMLHDIGFYGNL